MRVRQEPWAAAVFGDLRTEHLPPYPMWISEDLPIGDEQRALLEQLRQPVLPASYFSEAGRLLPQPD